MDDKLESKDFYELCQQYRHARDPIEDRPGLLNAQAAFEAIKDWLRANVMQPMALAPHLPKVLDEAVLERAKTLYAGSSRAYRGTRPLPWHEAPLSMRQEFIDKAEKDEARFAIMQDRLFNPAPGVRGIFDNEGGWPYQQEAAAKRLTLGAEYTVMKVEVHTSHTRIWLAGQGEGYNDWFNNMMFRTAGVKGTGGGHA